MKTTYSKKKYWYTLSTVIFLIKFTMYFWDSSPMFFLGDSQVYINTALFGQMPASRSFVYGLIIKLTAVTTHSLQSLVFFQIILSAFTAIIAAYILMEFFVVSRKWAFGAGILCALEPLQLFYERYVMTEAITLFVFALFIVMILEYLRKPTINRIVVIQLIGLFLISMRMIYLPIVLVMTVVLPLLIFLKEYFLQRGICRKTNVALIMLSTHLVVSIGCMYIFHTSYKHLVGHLLHRPPAYVYDSGFSLLMCWSPIVEPEDFEDLAMGRKVFSLLTQDPKNRKRRGAQLCWEGGFSRVIRGIVPNRLEADRVAKDAAVHAAKRNPQGLISLYWQSLLDYWNIGYLKGVMRFDRGSTRVLPEKFKDLLFQYFGLHADRQPFMKTPTNLYFFHAWPWYLFILLTPIFAFFNFICIKTLWTYRLTMLTVSCFLVTIPATFPAVRYMHPLGWLIFIVLTPILSKLFGSAENN